MKELRTIAHTAVDRLSSVIDALAHKPSSVTAVWT